MSPGAQNQPGDASGQSSFVSEVFHKLSQPLTALQCSLELCLERDKSPQEFRASVGAALENVERLRQRLLLLRELNDADDPGDISKPVQLQELLQELQQDFLPVCESVGGYFTVSCEPLRVRGNGAKLRLKYIAPSTGAFFWGVNFELGRTSHRVTESNDNFELRPILGWRGGAWLVAINPIIDAALSGGTSREPVFAPALKVSRAVAEGVQLGIEHYAELGPIHHIPDFNQQNHMLFGALDVQKGALDLNFGVGRGLTSASEKWVVKMIVGIPLH